MENEKNLSSQLSGKPQYEEIAESIKNFEERKNEYSGLQANAEEDKKNTPRSVLVGDKDVLSDPEKREGITRMIEAIFNMYNSRLGYITSQHQNLEGQTYRLQNIAQKMLQLMNDGSKVSTFFEEFLGKGVKGDKRLLLDDNEMRKELVEFLKNNRFKIEDLKRALDATIDDLVKEVNKLTEEIASQFNLNLKEKNWLKNLTENFKKSWDTAKKIKLVKEQIGFLKQLQEKLENYTKINKAQEVISSKRKSLVTAINPEEKKVDKADIERRRKYQIDNIQVTDKDSILGDGRWTTVQLKNIDLIDQTINAATEEEAIQQINAKYDAELAVLEKTKKPSDVNQSENPDSSDKGEQGKE